MKFIGNKMVGKEYFGIPAVFNCMKSLKNIHIQAMANKIN